MLRKTFGKENILEVNKNSILDVIQFCHVMLEQNKL